MSTIDHKAASEKFLDDAQGFFWDDDPTQVTLRFTAAQVHATLALVEQQRIANLIAYKQLHTGRFIDGDVVHNLPVSADEMTRAIEEGLLS